MLSQFWSPLQVGGQGEGQRDGQEIGEGQRDGQEIGEGQRKEGQEGKGQREEEGQLGREWGGGR